MIDNYKNLNTIASRKKKQVFKVDKQDVLNN